jgi:YesN/AraC family two-component response regulator
MINTNHSLAKILVVDDEPQLEYFLTEGFEEEIHNGLYEFHFALNRLEALEKLAKNHYDLELVDIVMPDVKTEWNQTSGLIYLKQVNQLYPSLNSIVISAFGKNYATLKSTLSLKICDYFDKPIRIKKLKKTLEENLPLKLSSGKKTNESQKKISYKIAEQVSLDLHPNHQYKLVSRLIQDFTIEQVEALSEELAILKAVAREKQQQIELLLEIDKERIKQEKLPLLPLKEGKISLRTHKYTSTDGEVKIYQYIHIRSPHLGIGEFSSSTIPKKHLRDPDVRKIVEEKLGRAIDPELYTD